MEQRGSSDTVILPPNQALAAAGKWPVVGEQAAAESAAPWQIAVDGLVAQPRGFLLDDLLAWPRQTLLTDIHCVTRWSRLGVTFEGVWLADLLAACGGALPQARFVNFIARSARNHATSLPLPVALDLKTMIAFSHQGQALEGIHGGPVRTIVPGRYFYKSLKWLTRIELMAEDRLGYWEGAAGYHNNADPWAEERYIASGIDRREVERMVRERNIAGRDLLSLQAAHMHLPDLDATGALLRNANFCGATLSRARFDTANLSNAQFLGSQLAFASFLDADLEGADFRGADLRGVNLTGASLFGTTFVPEPLGAQLFDFAKIDASTCFDQNALERLSPIQLDFVLANATVNPSLL